MLRDEGIQFQVCRNPDVKCAVVERVHRTIRGRLFNYFTFSNSYRYIDVLPKFSRLTMIQSKQQLEWRRR